MIDQNTTINHEPKGADASLVHLNNFLAINILFFLFVNTPKVVKGHTIQMLERKAPNTYKYRHNKKMSVNVCHLEYIYDVTLLRCKRRCNSFTDFFI